MISQVYREPLYVFIAIYAIFAVIILYAVFSNQGLEIHEQFNENTGEKEFFVENLTKRKINDINVTFADNRTGKILKSETIQSLIPGEKKPLDLQAVSAAEIKITAQSKFYAPAEKLVLLRVEQPSLRTSYPRTVQLGQRFDFSVEYCNNQFRETQSVKVEERHDKVFFFERPHTDNSEVKPGECRQFTYNFLAAHRGETKIYFNVITANTSEQIEGTIRVE